MKIIIEFFPDDTGAQIFINGEWFKEIGGLENKAEVLQAIATNEDLLQEIGEQ